MAGPRLIDLDAKRLLEDNPLLQVINKLNDVVAGLRASKDLGWAKGQLSDLQKKLLSSLDKDSAENVYSIKLLSEALGYLQKHPEKPNDVAGYLGAISTNADRGFADLQKMKERIETNAQKKNEPGQENEFTKPTEMSFEWLTANATYSNIETYIAQKKAKGESYSPEELKLLKYYLVGELASEDYEKYLQNRSYTNRTYGGYASPKGKPKNDCYTYANIKIFERYENEYEGANHSLIGTRTNTATGWSEGNDRLAPGFTSLSNISTLNLQVGDAVGVDLSPNNSGSNHWGIVVLVLNKETGQLEPRLAARGSSSIRNPDYSDLNELWTIEKFFQYANRVDIIRYGNAKYSQHIEVDVSTMKAKVVDGKQPKSFTD